MFETKHTHRLAKPSDVLYIRFEFSLVIFYVEKVINSVACFVIFVFIEQAP